MQREILNMKTNTQTETKAAHTPGLAISATKRSVTRIIALVEAAQSASDWLCEAQAGTVPSERGKLLRSALVDFMAPNPADAGGVRLIAAAPELLSALKRALILSEGMDAILPVALPHMGMQQPYDSEVTSVIRAAIAKAEGRA